MPLLHSTGECVSIGVRNGMRVPCLSCGPFGPVALVYDWQDTEGDPLPADVSFFQASGEITQERMKRFLLLMERKGIKHQYFDGGDCSAGSIVSSGQADE